MRRYRDLLDAHESDLGGSAIITEAERRLVRRAAMLTVQLEMMDARFAQSESEASKTDLDTYQRASNSLRRLLESLGTQRRAKDVGPSLGDMLREDFEQRRKRGDVTILIT